METLITGGAGYIGSTLIRKLLNRGDNVTIIDNFKHGDYGIRDIRDKIT